VRSGTPCIPFLEMVGRADQRKRRIQSFTTEQLYYGGRSSRGLEISLTDHPAIFVLLAVLYSNGFFLFGAGVLLAIVECLRAMREP
jgi:hypothetical protein